MTKRRAEKNVDPGELIDEAWDALDANNPVLATANARSALARDPLAVDAFVILALVEDVQAIRVAYLREGVNAGETALRDTLKDWRRADFWLDLETRPYMRAVHNLALELWSRGAEGDRDAAADLIGHLLQINPNDNQGARMLAYARYPALGRWGALAKLLRRYRKEVRTETLYTLAVRRLAASRSGCRGSSALRRGDQSACSAVAFGAGKASGVRGSFGRLWFCRRSSCLCGGRLRRVERRSRFDRLASGVGCTLSAGTSQARRRFTS